MKNFIVKNVLLIIEFVLAFNTQVNAQENLSNYKIGSKYIETFKKGTYSTDKNR